MSELHFTSPDGLTIDLRLPEHPTDAVPEYRSTISPRKTTNQHNERAYPLPLPPLPTHTARRFGNPTPVGLGGFLLANTPATIMLPGWHGAGGRNGNESAAIGTFFYLGCLLEILCGIGEWINGETFNAAVFLILGGYFGASGAVMVPFYNAISGYGTDATAAEATYHDSYAMLLIFMGVLLLFFTIASVRLDICHVVLFACFTVCFPCLATSYFYMADGNEATAHTFRIWGGIFSLAGSVILWYLFLGSLLEAVDFPYLLPVGDLSNYVKGRTEYLGRRRHKTSMSCGL
ncbi:hypothetical protein LTR91_025291 [Friedmanniomyces endolithicus]|uniref:GPR1/FUN34/YaaH-class plasma membrane protein n=1 Tax=Friedmanniomyces endolithicus TaxID=329885 RepID=A0AAN6H056_9PEZI|nr:hypothetical protein LTR94_018570 [Friedmanniomyces endolithicus]KAK0772984.1 hypothetical protein LTR59_015456 [Friedmanniomyces endolithicus]KAK0776943.1 hypothetical protein LTR38_015335 [Friedmanniomyces endolithicus]KAK0820555.1 hypothetical protein LTR75_001718 [Friedmanniomyces endolithicus]KAK0831917.1 hypothetical protein LTR03_015342 [Friedmanniomyces endolithicus]